jgi:DNA mismatch endonuclease (patch repair protein)
MMAGIRSKNTKPEMVVRRFLHGQGYRYRLHRKDLPGTPDLVLPKYQAVIFVHGCFWHGHDCRYYRLPKTRTAFWAEKIAGNRSRDEKNQRLLEAEGWRVIVVRECEIRDNLDWEQRLLGELASTGVIL